MYNGRQSVNGYKTLRLFGAKYYFFASLGRTISLVISVRTLKHGGFRVKAGPPQSGEVFLFNVNSNFLCLE